VATLVLGKADRQKELLLDNIQPMFRCLLLLIIGEDVLSVCSGHGHEALNFDKYETPITFLLSVVDEMIDKHERFLFE
jgi:hypothetical protein